MSTPILIVAHPGHELRLHGWMEHVRPIVCILTDGAGGASVPRTHHSCAVLSACGATPGPVLGWRSDRAWYAALLAADPAPFLEAADLIAAAAPNASLIVADPVEGYNPMHDLASALADRVAQRTGGQRLTYPLMRPATPLHHLPLDPDAIARKRAAIAGYTPLAAEAAALVAQQPDSLAHEYLAPETWLWPTNLVTAPEYERIGRDRATAGRYSATITYAGHVRPMAARLRTL